MTVKRFSEALVHFEQQANPGSSSGFAVIGCIVVLRQIWNTSLEPITPPGAHRFSCRALDNNDTTSTDGEKQTTAEKRTASVPCLTARAANL